MNENQIQKTVFDWCRANQIFAWHPPNDRSSRTKSGYLKGCADVHMLHRGEFFALELKTDTGRATLEQMDFIAKVNDRGGFGFVAHGWDNAEAVLKSWFSK